MRTSRCIFFFLGITCLIVLAQARPHTKKHRKGLSSDQEGTGRKSHKHHKKHSSDKEWKSWMSSDLFFSHVEDSDHSASDKLPAGSEGIDTSSKNKDHDSGWKTDIFTNFDDSFKSHSDEESAKSSSESKDESDEKLSADDTVTDIRVTGVIEGGTGEVDDDKEKRKSAGASSNKRTGDEVSNDDHEFYDYDEDEDKEDEKQGSDFRASEPEASSPKPKNQKSTDANTRPVYGMYGFDAILPRMDYGRERLDEERDGKHMYPLSGIDLYPQRIDPQPESKPEVPHDSGDYPHMLPKSQIDLRTSPNPPTPLPDQRGSTVTVAVQKQARADDEHKTELAKVKPQYIQSKPLESCDVDFDCAPGRMCRAGICVCGSEVVCQGHNKQVCGSDGVLYNSHCELHRTACITGVHIKLDHQRSCEQRIDYKDVLQESSDSEQTIPQQESALPPASQDVRVDSKSLNQGDTDKQQQSEDSNRREDDDIIKSKFIPQPPLVPVPPVISKIKLGTDMTVKPSAKPKTCSLEEYTTFKGKLLDYHCIKWEEPNCNQETVENKHYLATLMFSYYDRDEDGLIEKDELWDIELREKFEEFSSSCTLLHMLEFDDSGAYTDKKISSEEFLKAFDVPVVLETYKVIPTLATAGNGLEIRCGIQDASDIVWKRHGIDILDLHFPGITVFEDGSLFIDTVSIQHMGNYTCQDRNRPILKQIHTLQVSMPPVVTVAPSSQLKEWYADIHIKCHAEGIPRPKVSWEINEMELPPEPNHFFKTHSNGTLVIHNANYQRDTGAYKCKARNQAGEAEDISTVFIQKPNETHSSGISHTFTEESVIVFHQEGYAVYKPKHCLTERHVKASFGNFRYIPDDLDDVLSMCPLNRPCVWGSTVNVKDKFIYVSQPEQDRVLLIDIVHTMNPIQIVKTDRNPRKLHYVADLDQVWVLCWNGHEDTGSKTIVVIREASNDIQHHTVHTQPIGNRFDLVQDMFLPPANDLGLNFRFGYVIHNEQRGMFKLDLHDMSYLKAVDFSKFDCLPKSVGFLPLGGHVLVKCIQRTESGERTLQLLMDHISDVVLANRTLYGTPYVSPDSRHVVTVDDVSGKVYVSTVSDNGRIKSAFDVMTGTHISDVTFFPSVTSAGYDLFLASQERNEAVFVSLTNGKVVVIKDIGETDVEKAWAWTEANRVIVSGNVFSEHLAWSAKSTLFIINGRENNIECKFSGLKNGNIIAFSNHGI